MREMMHFVVSVLYALANLPATLLNFVLKWLHFRRLANRFPAPHAYPIIGHLLYFGFPLDADILLSQMLEDLERNATGQFVMGPLRFIYISEPEDLQRYLKNPKNQSKPEIIYRMFSDFMGKGLFTENGDRWRGHTKIILPSFHTNILNSYIPIFDQKSDIFVEVLRKHADGNTFDVNPMVEHLTLDIIIESLMGVPSNQQIQPDIKLFKAMAEGRKLLRYRVSRPWYYSISFFNWSPVSKTGKMCVTTLRELTAKVIQQKGKILQEQDPNSMNEQTKPGKNCLLDSLLLEKEKGTSITDTDIEDEVLTAILAGYDTPHITVSLVLYLLARHQNVQERVFQEIRTVFTAIGRSELTREALERMPYLKMVIKETLRFYTPAFFLGKRTGEDTPLVTSNLVIPAGANVLYSPKALHRNPKLYPDPDVFDPERFSPENCARRHPYAFLPFGVGKRACIATTYAMVEMTIILAKVLWNYEVQPDPSYKPHFKWAVVTAPDNGVWIKLLKRQMF